MSCSDVATERGCTVGAVYSFCNRNNIHLPKKSRGGKNVKDMTGQKCGSLLVICREASVNKLAAWRCRCECGKEVIATGSDLRQGKIKTCGCRIGIKTRRNWQGTGNIPKNYWSCLNKNAIQRSIQFDLEIEYLDKLYDSQHGKCALSGLFISFVDKTASLDRIDNKKGYLPGNVQWVHKDINKLKGIFESNYFFELCKLVGDFYESKRSNR